MHTRITIRRHSLDGVTSRRRGIELYEYILVCCGVSAVADHASFCETETFHATCALDEVIVMTRAQYGRMRISRCVKLDYGHLGCEADVLELADARCSGRRRCEIRIPDHEFAKNKPCPEDLKPYFEAAYKCVKGMRYRIFSSWIVYTFVLYCSKLNYSRR